jgi:hypothetical protein
MQPQLPIAGNTPCRSRHRLVQRMMFWRRKPRAVVELAVAVVVEPMFFRFVTGDHGMQSGLGVPSGMLARRLVTAADVAALGAPAPDPVRSTVSTPIRPLSTTARAAGGPSSLAAKVVFGLDTCPPRRGVATSMSR